MTDSTYHYVNPKLEVVLKEFIVQNNMPCDNVYTFGEISALGAGIQEPYIAIKCRLGSPSFPELQLSVATGNRTITSEIIIRSRFVDETNGRKSQDIHDDLVGAVMDTFFQPEILTVLNSIASSYKIGIDQIYQPDDDTEFDESGHRTIIKFVIDCHPNP